MSDTVSQIHNFTRFVAVKGMDWRWPFTWTTSAGVAKDVSSYTFTGIVRASQSPTATSIATISFDTTNAVNGVVVPYVPRATTATLSLTDDTPYWLEVEYVDGTGYRYPLFAGPLTVIVRSVA